MTPLLQTQATQDSPPVKDLESREVLVYDRDVALQIPAPSRRRLGSLEVRVGADHQILYGARELDKRSLAESSAQDTQAERHLAEGVHRSRDSNNRVARLCSDLHALSDIRRDQQSVELVTSIVKRSVDAVLARGALTKGERLPVGLVLDAF